MRRAILRLLLSLGLVAALVIAAALLRPLAFVNAHTRLVLWRAGVASKEVAVNDLRLHYLEARPPANTPGGGTPLLLLHGLGARALDWAPMLPALARAGFHVYAPDLPGYGDSTQPDADYSIRYQEGAVVAFADALHLTHPDVAGWSMGGWIALRLAADHPTLIRRLVLYDSAGLYFPRDYTDDLFTPTDLPGVERLWKHLTPDPRPIPAFIARDILRRSQQNAWVLHRSLTSMLSGRDLMDFRLQEIQAPTLVVWGLDDHLIPPSSGQQMARAIPHATFVGIPGCGHLTPSACAPAALAPTLRFLQQR